MKVSIVNYDCDSKEADVKFENEGCSLLTYCPLLSDNKLPQHTSIEAFLPSNFLKTSDEENIKKNSDYYSYSLIGKVIDINNNKAIVSIFGIEIILDNIPSDIKINDNLYFDVKRLDCICD
jgi:hypothetical protein